MLTAAGAVRLLAHWLIRAKSDEWISVEVSACNHLSALLLLDRRLKLYRRNWNHQPMTFTEEMVSGSGGVKLFVHHHPAVNLRAQAVLIHGFGEHSGRYHLLIESLARQGIAVTAYDHRGHGKSEGLYGHVDCFSDYESDLRRILEYARRREPAKDCFLIAHSMGGLVALRYLMGRHTGISGAVISAPLIRLAIRPPTHKVLIAKIAATISPRLRLPNEIDPAVLSRDPEIGKAYAADALVGKLVSARWFIEALRAMEELRHCAAEVTLPLLVMHGTKDRLASVEATQELFAQLGSTDKELAIYDGFYHELFNEPEKQELYARVNNWINARLR